MHKILEKREDFNHEAGLTLSVSKVKTFKDCPAKYKFNYIEKLPQKEWEFLSFGKFLHEVLETYYKSLLSGDNDSHNLILTKAWKLAFINWKAKLSGEQITDAKKICNEFLVDQLKTSKNTAVIGVEKSFYIDIDGKVLLNGFIDRVQLDADGVIHVTDYKTTKNKKYLKNDFFQLLTYAYVMCLEDPSLKKVRGSYILLRHGFEMIVKEFERDEIMTMESKFLDYANNISAEKLFRPKPTMLCNYCSFLDACDAGQNFTGKQNVKYGESKW